MENEIKKDCPILEELEGLVLEINRSSDYIKRRERKDLLKDVGEKCIEDCVPLSPKDRSNCPVEKALRYF